MTVEQWRRISALFAAAQVLDPGERDAFLDAACARFPEDRREIDSLLSRTHESGFLEPRAASSDLASSHASSATQGPFQIGQQLGKYLIVRRLKPGGMGVLYVAEDNLRREVVLKVLAPDLASEPRQRVRLRHEAEAMARLQHPNIATVYAFEELEEVSVLVSELVRGRDLRERLDEDGPLDPRALLDLAVDVAEALSAAHRAGIIHRDLKPENIMLPTTGGVKLVDFGIARVDVSDAETQPKVTLTGTLVGTPAYMTPEQLQGLRVDHRCDVFALGIVLYEAGTSTHPFAGRTRATTMINILTLQQPSLGSRRALDFGPLEAIIAKCLRKSPDERYGSADDLIEHLRLARARLPLAQARTPVAPPPAAAYDQGATWWWRFHQAAVSLFYALAVIPLWLARLDVGGPARDVLFFGGLGLAVASILLRLNGAFLARHSPDLHARQRRRSRAAIVAIDLLLLVVLAGGALLVRETNPGLATAFLTMAIGGLVTLLVIEPATARAAFAE